MRRWIQEVSGWTLTFDASIVPVLPSEVRNLHTTAPVKRFPHLHHPLQPEIHQVIMTEIQAGGSSGSSSTVSDTVRQEKVMSRLNGLYPDSELLSPPLNRFLRHDWSPDV